VLLYKNNVYIIKIEHKYSLSNLEVFSCNKAQISWNPVTKPHFNNVTNH